MARAYADDLRKSVEGFIRDRFDPIKIEAVEIYEDCERDGSPVLEITVFFEGTPLDLARQEPPGFLTKLRQHLSDMHEDAFPLVSFRPTSLQAA